MAFPKTTFLHLPREVSHPDFLVKVEDSTCCSLQRRSQTTISAQQDANKSQIRNIIYGYSLKAERPIPVFDKLERYHADRRLIKKTHRPYRLHEHVTANLIKCRNRVVAFEAAMALYEMNTFIFRSSAYEDAWYTLCDFFSMIGPSNRLQLRNLSIAIDTRLHSARPKLARGHPDYLDPVYSLVFENGLGRRASVWPGSLAPCDPERPFGPRSNVPTYSTPVIDACFRLLGRAGPPLTFALELEGWSDPDIGRLGKLHSSFDDVLPRVLEASQRKHTLRPDGQSRMSLIWRGREMPGRWTKREIELAGWEVMTWVPYSAHQCVYHPLLDFDIRWKAVNMPSASPLDAGTKRKAVYPCLEEKKRAIREIK